MNERILELSEQASKWVCENEPMAFDDTDLFYELMQEKFAELIVKECMELTKQCSTGKGIHDLFADEIIAQHFGVEE
jgi:hypothetical protein